MSLLRFRPQKQLDKNEFRRICHPCGATDRWLNRCCSPKVVKNSDGLTPKQLEAKKQGQAIKEANAKTNPEARSEWYRAEKRRRLDEATTSRCTFNEAKKESWSKAATATTL